VHFLIDYGQSVFVNLFQESWTLLCNSCLFACQPISTFEGHYWQWMGMCVIAQISLSLSHLDMTRSSHRTHAFGFVEQHDWTRPSRRARHAERVTSRRTVFAYYTSL